MRFSFPITKTEKTEDGRLLIEGVATSEALDCQGDILDFEGSKRAFAKWRGNVREQHDPKKAVGKALEVIPDDGSKSIAVRAFISAGAKDTQEKVLDGTLAMFSVGGGPPTKTKLEKVDGKSVRRVLDWPMTELSLVDVGANPDAAVSVLKAAGMEDEGEPPAEEKPKEEPPAEKEAGPEKAEEPPQLTEAQMTELVEKVTDAVLAALKAKAGEEVKPVEEPAATPEQKSVPEPEVKKTDGMAAYDVRSALDCLAGLEMLRSCEAYEVMAGTPEPPEQLVLLDVAIKALKEFVASEAKELLEGEGEAMPAEKSARRPIIIKVEQPVDFTALLEKLASIQKSAPTPDPRLDALAAIEPISKAVSELKAVTDGEFKAIRKDMSQILSMPVPGRAPLRNMAAAAQLLEKTAAPTATNDANALRKAAQGAPHAVRDYLLHEALTIERG